jgi:hypothetical protein
MGQHVAEEGESGCRRLAPRFGFGEQLVQWRIDEVAPGFGGALWLAMVEQGWLLVPGSPPR